MLIHFRHRVTVRERELRRCEKQLFQWAVDNGIPVGSMPGDCAAGALGEGRTDENLGLSIELKYGVERRG